MKTKVLFVFSIVLLLCSACHPDMPVSDSPLADATKLWPAADSTGEKVGYINEKGEMVIPAQYWNAYFFSGGTACVVTDDNQLHFINPSGNVVYSVPENVLCDPYLYYGARWFKQNDYFDNDGMYDKDFKVIIPEVLHRSIERVMSKDGLVFFSDMVQNVEGFLNRKGDTVLFNPRDTVTYWFKDWQYYSRYFCDGREIVLSAGGKFGAINTKGELVIDTIYSKLRQLGADRLSYMSGAKYGLMDVDGNIITEEIFSDVYVFGDNNLLPVKDDNGTWGYVDNTGSYKIVPKFLQAYPFYEGVALAMSVNYEEKRLNLALIDTNGDVLWEDRWEIVPAAFCHNGLILLRDDSVYKYVDRKKNVVYSWKWSKNNFFPNISVIKPFLVSARHKQKTQDNPEEQILRLYEGAPFFPLMEQRFNHIQTENE